MAAPAEKWWGINPGKPFWSAFTAFCANMVALLGLAKLSVIEVDESWLGALLASLLVAGAIYGREKIAAHVNGNGT